MWIPISEAPIACFPHFEVAAESGDWIVVDKLTEDGTLYYKIVAKKAHITGCAEGVTDVVIPDTIVETDEDGDTTEYPVTFIAAEAFYGNQEITSVTLPDSLVGIGASAFCACTGLTEVVIPDSVSSINASAFCMCSSLVSVKLPACKERTASCKPSAFNFP